MNSLYKVQKRDLKKCGSVLARAFQNYPMYRYILGEQNSFENIEKATRFFVRFSFYYANVYAPSDEIHGVLGFVDYEKYKMNFYRSLRSGALSLAKLGSEIGKRFNDYEQFNTGIHAEVIKGPHQYIMFVGVDPHKQGQGLGSQLMRPVLELAKAVNKPTYLETHDKRNVEIYYRYGFTLAGEYQLPNSDIMLYSMLKT